VRCCGIETLDIEIQAALADGGRTFALDPGCQLVQVFGTMIGEKHRMQAVGGIQACLGAAQVAQFREARDANRRNHLDASRPRRARARAPLAIGVEFGDVEM
jgi:hypothetical protein